MLTFQEPTVLNPPGKVDHYPLSAASPTGGFADHIKRQIIIASIAGKTKVTVDQMYTPQLTSRRNAALLHCKELIKKDSTLQAFLEYPAKLMGRKRGMGEKYIIIKEF